MMKVQEVAKRLNCSVSTVYELVEAGKLAAYRIGLRRGSIRVTEEQIEAYLASCQSTPLEPKPSSPRIKLKHLRV